VIKNKDTLASKLAGILLIVVALLVLLGLGLLIRQWF
jgi:hypothetical protein